MTAQVSALNEVYLTHYIRQSCGWVKVHEYTLDAADDPVAVEADIRSRYPNDEARFEIRRPKSAAS